MQNIQVDSNGHVMYGIGVVQRFASMDVWIIVTVLLGYSTWKCISGAKC